MILKVNDKIYLQNYVIPKIAKNLLGAPSSIAFELAFQMERLAIESTSDAVRFENCFEEPENIDYLQDCNFLPDFAVLSQKSISELEVIRDKCIAKHNTYVSEHADDQFDDPGQKLAISYARCDLFCEGIWLLIGIKKGEIPMPALPEGITLQIPELLEPKAEVEVAEAAPKKPKRGLFNFFKRS